MQRRHLLAASAAALLGGCGFQLRQPPQFDFQSIALAMPPGNSTTQALNRQLQNMGYVQVIADPAKADVVLESPGETRQTLVLSTTSSGEVREIQLQLNLPFQLRTHAGAVLLPSSQLTRVSSLSYSETAALSKGLEEDLLYQSMRSDIVQQLIRRLATVRMPAAPQASPRP